MKFTAKEVLDKLKQTLGKTQKLSDRTILDMVTNTIAFLPDDSDMELDDFVKKVEPTVKSANTNFNDEQGKFIKEWEKNNTKQTEPDPTKTEPDVNKDEPAWFKAYREKSEKEAAEVKAKFEAMEKGKSNEALRANAIKKFMAPAIVEELNKNPKSKAYLDKKIPKILSLIGDDDTEDTLVERLTEEFNDLKTLDGYIPSEQGGGGGNAGGGAQAQKDPALLAHLINKGVKIAEDKKET